MKVQTDTKIFLLYYKVAVFVGLAPARFNENNMPKKLLYKFFVGFLLLFMIAWSTLFLQERVRVYNQLSLPIFLIVDTIQNIIEIFFICVCISMNEIRGQVWENSLNVITLIEKDFTSKNSKFGINQENIICCIFSNFICIIFSICAHLLEMSMLSKTTHPRYYLLNFKICMFFYEIFIVGFIHNIMKVLKSRYDLLNKVLEEVLKSDEKEIESKLADLGKIHKKLYTLTQNCNNLFGWPMFFLLFCTTFAMLNCLNGLFLNDSNAADLWKVLVLNISFASIYLVSINIFFQNLKLVILIFNKIRLLKL